MPGFVVHEGATVLCEHPPGTAQPNAPFPRVKVSGQAVVTQASPYTITGCELGSTSNPPCATAQFTSAASRVFAGGAPLLLQDSSAVCVPTGTGLRIAVTQTRVRGT